MRLLVLVAGLLTAGCFAASADGSTEAPPATDPSPTGAPDDAAALVEEGAWHSEREFDLDFRVFRHREAARGAYTAAGADAADADLGTRPVYFGEPTEGNEVAEEARLRRLGHGPRRPHRRTRHRVIGKPAAPRGTAPGTDDAASNTSIAKPAGGTPAPTETGVAATPLPPTGGRGKRLPTFVQACGGESQKYCGNINPFATTPCLQLNKQLLSDRCSRYLSAKVFCYTEVDRLNLCDAPAHGSGGAAMRDRDPRMQVNKLRCLIRHMNNPDIRPTCRNTDFFESLQQRHGKRL